MGQLGQAFNTMIDEIEVAFAERAASEDRLRRFLADASHELRTPLTSILGYSELFDLGMQDRPADLAVSLRHIRDEATRMATLVDDLFLLAQLDHERPLRFEPVDLVDLARRASAAFSASAPDRPVTVVGDGPVMVEGDADRLRQVVDNLAVNAISHTPAGSAVEITGDRRSTGPLGRRHRPRRRTGHRSRVTPPGSSSRSTGRTPRGPVRRGAPGLGWPSWPPSSRPTGARWPWCRDRGATFEVRLPKVHARSAVRPGAEGARSGVAQGGATQGGATQGGAANGDAAQGSEAQDTAPPGPAADNLPGSTPARRAGS